MTDLQHLPDDLPVPGVDLPDGWDAIPGARGCTTEACDFRDHHAELLGAGATAVYGLSSQDSHYQSELVIRLRLPFDMLADPDLAAADALQLPTFTTGGLRLFTRLTLLLRDGVIEHVFYPVFPPNQPRSPRLAAQVRVLVCGGGQVIGRTQHASTAPVEDPCLTLVGPQGPKMSVVVVQHVDFEGPALIEQVLRERGCVVEVIRVDLQQPLPPAASIDVLVIMGGPMGAFDDDAHPHLPLERALIRNCVLGGRPVLGVCLGAQLLAAALGAAVRRGPVMEVGPGAVQLTEDGRRDPVLGGSSGELPVLHWHQDTFDLPPEAVLLASTATYAHQAFRFENAYGLQFHVEMDSAALDRIGPHLPPGVAVDKHEASEVAHNGREVLRRWADHVLPRQSRP